MRAMMEAFKSPARTLRAGYRELTGPLRALPSALIIGAQRSGTTSLFNYLAEHPDVLPPVVKEVHYFDLHYARGLRWYQGRFPFSHRLRGGALTMDASPYYLAHPLAPERAARLLPHARLVALLRNPIERAYSHYQHEVRDGRESLSFPEALDREAERLAGEEDRLRREPGYYSYNHHRYSYTRRGLYLEQLLQWVRHYPRAQLLVLQSEWLFRDPAAATSAVYDFLGLASYRLVDPKPFYQGVYEREIPLALRRKLAAYFDAPNRRLFQWLGQEFDWV